MDAILKSRWSQAGLALALVIVIVGIAFRPYWRDEYWALYFSGRELSLHDAIAARMTRDVHPPLYFIAQHFWRAPIEAEWWARIYNALVVVACGAGVWLLGRARRTETALFLLLCAGSYWVIYYSVELRMYGQLFGLCALSVVVMRNALADPQKVSIPAFVFLMIGAAAGLTHFFGALWIAVAGFWTGLALLRLGSWRGFLAWGAASVLALVPVIAWIAAIHPEHNPGADSVMLPWGQALYFAAEQFLRGLIVKTAGSNLAAFALLCVMAWPLLKRRDPFDAALALAALTVTLAAFAIHIFVTPLIKERAFIVIMPALLYLMTRAIDLAATSGAAPRLRAAIPIFCLISPLFFLSEYSKDRERWHGLRALIAAQGPACADAPILVYNRHSEQAADFHGYVTHMALRGAAGGRDPALLDSETVTHAPAAGACSVRALAMALPKGEGAEQAAARRAFFAAGLDLSRLEERRFGGGRQLAYVSR